MQQLFELKPYADDRGNVVVYGGQLEPGAKVRVSFRGSGNVLKIADTAKVVDLAAEFAGDNGRIDISETSKPRTGLRLNIRVGHESSVAIGANVGCETRMFVSASEGASVVVGEDCMIATGVELRTDDSHAIYDVRSRKRVNPARSITIGEHVWLGKSVVVMGGVTIGSGSVVGFRSIVTRDIPNNCVAVGAPTRVVRRNVAWERPVLAYRAPNVSGLAPGEVRTARYWKLTSTDPSAGQPEPGTRADQVSGQGSAARERPRAFTWIRHKLRGLAR
ncbi:acyltransferase [Gryllotalpicola kribbensis]|uniref:acyltransferase n=1 Tax=Gryllotalpicola kribbensis TaxID=993084 RepID=UPI0031D29ECB